MLPPDWKLDATGLSCSQSYLPSALAWQPGINAQFPSDSGRTRMKSWRRQGRQSTCAQNPREPPRRVSGGPHEVRSIPGSAPLGDLPSGFGKQDAQGASGAGSASLPPLPDWTAVRGISAKSLEAIGGHQFWTRLGTLNPLDLCAFTPARSVTAVHSDAPAGIARWKVWLRSATRARFGELDSSGCVPGRFVLRGFLTGHGGRTKQQTVTR
jgi:hypothetical protein